MTLNFQDWSQQLVKKIIVSRVSIEFVANNFQTKHPTDYFWV